MLRSLVITLVCLATLSAVGQSNSNYQVGTITAVERARDGDSTSSDGPTYDVSIKVAGTIYVVRYRPEFGLNKVEYAAGRDVLVLVGEKTVPFVEYAAGREFLILVTEKTITYNDMLGRSHELAIISEQPATASVARR
jgi:hypothetical protein